MRNYALMTIAITTALSALLLGLSFSGQAFAQDALADTLPAPASATTPSASAPATATTALPSGSAAAPVLTPAPGAGTTTSTTTTTTIGTVPTSTTSTSSVIVPVTSTTSTLPVGGPVGGKVDSGGGLTMSPVMPSAVQDAMTRLQKVDQINLDDMIRAQDAINRLDLLLEIEKRQTELKKVRDERNKPAVTAAAAAAAASGLLGSAIPASALNLPKIAATEAPPPPSSSSSSSSSFTPPKPKSSEGPSEKLSIRRISGTDGRYFAVINMDDNSSRTVNVGDKLPDGTIVKEITLTSVSLLKDKKSKNLTIPSDSYIVRESGNSIQ